MVIGRYRDNAKASLICPRGELLRKEWDLQEKLAVLQR